MLHAPYRIIRAAYDNTLRSFLPRKEGVLNGVVVKHPRLLDRTTEFPEYESVLLNGVRSMVEPGDRVLVIGAGRGVSTVTASQQAGEGGTVTAIEASSQMLPIIKYSIDANPTPAPVELRHAVVGEVSEYSEEHYGPGDGGVLSPDELPGADVAILDCEGAELALVPRLEAERFIIETHGSFGSPTKQVRDRLTDRGYSIVSDTVEQPERDIHILVATR